MNYIHLKAEVDKNVKLGDNVSIWAFSVLRGDKGIIRIGNNTNIQEHVVIHGENVEIGNNVTVGHSAIIHGAKIGDNVLIGINATILDGVEIGDYLVVAAGTVIPPNSKIPSNSFVAGVLGKIKRILNEEDKKFIIASYKAYLERIKNLY